MASNNTVTLYDLQLASGCTISPFVWATKYALKHKGLDIECVPGGFTGILERTGGRSERLPVIVDDGEWVLDSWLIAEYLDRKYPDRPPLFTGESMKILTRFLEGWLWTTAIRPWFGCYIKDYRDLSLPQDHEYVTRTRENMLGTQAGGSAGGARGSSSPDPADSRALPPARAGEQVAGRRSAQLLRLSGAGDFPVDGLDRDDTTAHEDDPLRDWLDRGFDLYGGLGRHPGMKTLFGLKLRPGDPEPFAKGPPLGGLATRNTGPESTKAETERITRGGTPTIAERTTQVEQALLRLFRRSLLTRLGARLQARLLPEGFRGFKHRGAEPNHFRQAAQLQLLHHPCFVNLHCTRADLQLLRDITVLHTGHHVLQNVALARCQPAEPLQALAA